MRSRGELSPVIGARVPMAEVRRAHELIDGAQREELARELRKLKAALPPELAAFADALGEVDGDVVSHDQL